MTTLNHQLDLGWLREAYRRTRKDCVRGVDGQSAQEYGEKLEENLQSLLERAKAGTYRAPAVRRVHIPKGNGETRPIGIPTFEDKVLQQAVTMVLDAVYEQDFLPCNYGFRPERNAHQCIETLREEARKMAGGWVLEVDIRKFFDTIQHPLLLGPTSFTTPGVVRPIPAALTGAHDADRLYQHHCEWSRQPAAHRHRDHHHTSACGN